MFQAVCVTKSRSLGQFDTKAEALDVAKKHRSRTRHSIKVFDVVAEEEKATGRELINDQVETAEEITMPTLADPTTETPTDDTP